MTVQVSTKLNRSHLAHGKRALVLPCLARTDKDQQATGPQGGTVEDAMSMVHIFNTGIYANEDRYRALNSPRRKHLEHAARQGYERADFAALYHGISR
jgi:hypothetical protein